MDATGAAMRPAKPGRAPRVGIDILNPINRGALIGHATVDDIGDHDPSGIHLFKSMSEDISAIAADLGLPGLIRLSRLAVTPEQITELAPPTAPAKATDRRALTGETVQCEAIPPDVLAAIITEAIEQQIERHAYADVLAADRVSARSTARLTQRLNEGDAP
jgi:hypothetical protein